MGVLRQNPLLKVGFIGPSSTALKQCNWPLVSQCIVAKKPFLEVGAIGPVHTLTTQIRTLHELKGMLIIITQPKRH
jgi:hypothetical protein